MAINKIYALYFSATKTTEKVVTSISLQLADMLSLPFERIDFTLPDVRKNEISFDENSLVIVGTPVYAGRVPNVLLPYLTKMVRGNGALCVPIVLFGNRNFDDALIELHNIMVANGFTPISAGAFVGEHSFSKILAQNRPDKTDMLDVKKLAEVTYNRICAGDITTTIKVKGQTPIRPYYTPRDRNGNHINILKVTPKTNDNCINCGLCAKICPMGSINPANIREFVGICIKCCACVKFCPTSAKYYDDEGYLYHQHELEEVFSRRAENEIF